jgi:hypothetical protein
MFSLWLDSKLRFDLSRLVATGRRGEAQNYDMRDYLRVFEDVLIASGWGCWWVVGAVDRWAQRPA